LLFSSRRGLLGSLTGITKMFDQRCDLRFFDFFWCSIWVDGTSRCGRIKSLQECLIFIIWNGWKCVNTKGISSSRLPKAPRMNIVGRELRTSIYGPDPTVNFPRWPGDLWVRSEFDLRECYITCRRRSELYSSSPCVERR
jgi:hypothetical protein